MLTEEQKRRLLSIARDAMERHVTGSHPLPPHAIEDLPGASGVFVTIKERGQLRGCLGTLQMRAGLADEVARCARDSATEDPRFPPMRPEEIAGTSLEISVLGPLEEISPPSASEVVVGRHGLVVEQGHRRGLLLPQVAVEWGWTPEQFLRQTCHKAGLPLDGWQQGARVFRFEADVFGE